MLRSVDVAVLVTGKLIGPFDPVTIADLDVVAQAVGLCDELEVQVVDDDSLLRAGRRVLMPENERLAIVSVLRGVDRVCLISTDVVPTTICLPLVLSCPDRPSETQLLRPERIPRAWDERYATSRSPGSEPAGVESPDRESA